MKPTILTVSSANMDLNMRVKAAPAKSETVFGDSYNYVSGGKGANSATAFAKLGANSVFCSALGNDANGKTLKSIYEKDGIDTSCLMICNSAPTGLAAVTVENDGANRIVVFSGANALLSPEHSIKSANDVTPAAVFCHFEIPFKTVCAMSEYCSEHNIPMFIDAGPASKDYDLSELSPVTVFSPNETEAEVFTGVNPIDETSTLECAKVLANLVKAKYYVIKLGSRGCAVYDGDKINYIPAYKVKVVDTTAAGDSFTAAMALHYIKTDDIIKSCRFGNAVASITVSRKGAGESIPTEYEIANYLKEKNIEI